MSFRCLYRHFEMNLKGTKTKPGGIEKDKLQSLENKIQESTISQMEKKIC